MDNPYESPKASLLQTVAKANRCRTVWHNELGLSTVVGFQADLEAVELLFTSLLVQANAAMLRAGAKRDAYGRSRTRAFRQSFLIAYATRIGERLPQVTEQAEQQAGTASSGRGLLPVLRVRQQAVDDAVGEIFGGTLTSGRAVRATDAEAYRSNRRPWISGLLSSAPMSPAVACSNAWGPAAWGSAADAVSTRRCDGPNRSGRTCRVKMPSSGDRGSSMLGPL